ncbi:MAG: alanine--tRNA ligase, partial [Limisphaerales bacterium]
MTSTQIRQSYLDFFKSKGHTIVPSSSLMPDSPNLLFTNAGMNQFVPIFLGQRAPDVDKWAGAIPAKATRAADTQKCIRAGGKHNDLEDVGLDTYHHTFFEMLGNWSFGDYFKKEAIEWAWELVTGVWKFPKNRIYATVYKPGPGDPSDFDQEAYNYWSKWFTDAGLDPKVHIVYGNKKDNFWMMGDTGPCGPCSELHVDLTPNGDTKGSLVNKGSAQCIEIWNLVFIQFNANPDGTFSPLPAKHVDTGMGFERVSGIIQNTKGFSDFSRTISNYETDIFRPIFDKLEKMSGKTYKSTLPKSGSTGDTEQEKIDVAFRVIADHIRTLSFSIADGILPGNNDRNYVLRRILRRAVRYGRTLGFNEPFFYKLVDILADTMGEVFPEIRKKQSHVVEVILREEDAFNKTLDRGIEIFNKCIGGILETVRHNNEVGWKQANMPVTTYFPGKVAFELYDTYGFPFDLTELMAREHNLPMDKAGFEKLMEEQRNLARADHEKKKQVIKLSEDGLKLGATKFLGYDYLETEAVVQAVVPSEKPNEIVVVLDKTPLYAEMGGQVGDFGLLHVPGHDRSEVGKLKIVDTQKKGDAFLHRAAIVDGRNPEVGEAIRISVDAGRRHAIERHHTVTHLLHWALHEVVDPDATQKGSYVGPDKLTFDFSSAALTPEQVVDVEKLVNERILENAVVSWTEVPFSEIKGRKEIMQFFGEKYGDVVRVVQIGGQAKALNGYSMELCGGTHTRATGEIGLFRIVSENAVAAGIRRIEALSGLAAYEKAKEETALIQTIAKKVTSPIGELEKKVEALLAHQKELEKQIKSHQQKQAADLAKGLAARSQALNGTPAIVENVANADGDFLQGIADALKTSFKGVIVLGGSANGAVALIAAVSPDFTAKFQAGKIIQAIAPIVGGKGGDKPDNARGGGKDAAKLDEALAKA